MLLKHLQNRRDTAQNATLRGILLGNAYLDCTVVCAAPVSIPAARITQLFRTPSLGGQRAVQTALLPVPFMAAGFGIGSARLFAQNPAGSRFSLQLRAFMSSVKAIECMGNKGKIRCQSKRHQSKNGSQQPSYVRVLRPAVTLPGNRRLSAPVRGWGRPCFLTPTRLQPLRWLQGATSFIANRTPAVARFLNGSARLPRPQYHYLTVHDPTAVRFATRGGFACHKQSNKRARPCLKRY